MTHRPADTHSGSAGSDLPGPSLRPGLWAPLVLAFVVGACGDEPTEPGIEEPPNEPPVARLSTVESSGSTPFRVQLDASESSDPDGQIASYAWDFGDGAKASGAAAEHTYGAVGMYVVALTVRDDDGAEATALDSIFALAPPGPGDHTLRGSVWLDADADGTRDAGEPATAGMKVFLDEDGNGRADAGEVATVTLPDGSFVFEGLEGSRSYTVTQALTLGWTNTHPGGPGVGSVSTAAPPLRPSSPARIVEGTEVEGSDFPFMVTLLDASVDNNADAFFCGGTLISGFWVLTAGHCVFGAETSDLEVLVGTGNLSSGGERIGVDRIRITRAFLNEEGLDDDMAVLKLKRRVMLPRIRLTAAGRAAIVETGDTAVAVGWGRTGIGTEDISRQLRAVEMPIFDLTICKNLYSVETDGIICAGFEGGGPGTCFGDSGGPLAVPDARGRWVEVGVTSFGLNCGQSLPSAFTRVEPLLDFIFTNTEPELSGSHVVDWTGGSEVTVEFGNFR